MEPDTGHKAGLMPGVTITFQSYYRWCTSHTIGGVPVILFTLAGGIPAVKDREIGQIYYEVESVELWCSMVYSTVAPYVPRSISFKTNPFHMQSVLLTSQIINETVHVPSSTIVAPVGVKLVV